MKSWQEFLKLNESVVVRPHSESDRDEIYRHFNEFGGVDVFELPDGNLKIDLDNRMVQMIHLGKLKHHGINFEIVGGLSPRTED